MDSSDSHFEKGQKVVALMGGMGTCAMGYAAMQVAKAIGSKVIATTHKENKLPLLKGADEVVLDTGKLQDYLSGITKALELVEPKTL